MTTPAESIVGTSPLKRPSLIADGFRDVGGSSYLPTLDGWRAVAIVGVLICHGVYPLVQSNVHLADLAIRGAVGVDIFFALSGFLICSRLIQEESRKGFISLRNFYIRRCCRILPPYFAYVVFVAILSAAGYLALNRVEWLSSIFFCRNYLPPWALSNDRWYLAHFWSLSVEEQFYLMWPGALVVFGCARARWLALIVALPVAVWRVLPYGVNHPWLDPHWDKLLLGAALAIVLSDHENRERFRRWMKPWLFVSLTVIAALGIVKKLPISGGWMGFIFPVLLAATTLNPSWPVSRLLESAPLRWVGRLSYSLYIWQQFFLLGSHGTYFGIQSFPLNFVAVFLCASASYYAIERPMIAFGHRITTSRRVFALKTA